MKAARLAIGSFSVFALGIGIALAIVNGMLNKEVAINRIGDSANVLAFSAAFAMAGLVGIARRNRRGGDAITAVLYWLAAAIGLIGLSIDGGVVIWRIPLLVWIVVAALFGAVFMLPARSYRADDGGLS